MAFTEKEGGNDAETKKQEFKLIKLLRHGRSLKRKN